MASIDKRHGKYRVRIRRQGYTLCKAFQRKGDAEAWARDMERTIDRDGNPTMQAVSPRTASPR